MQASYYIEQFEGIQPNLPIFSRLSCQGEGPLSKPDPEGKRVSSIAAEVNASSVLREVVSDSEYVSEAELLLGLLHAVFL